MQEKVKYKLAIISVEENMIYPKFFSVHVLCPFLIKLHDIILEHFLAIMQALHANLLPRCNHCRAMSKT